MAQSRSVSCGLFVTMAVSAACGGSPLVRPVEPASPPAPTTVQGSFSLKLQVAAEPLALPVVVKLEPLESAILPPTPRQVVRIASSTDLFDPPFVVADTGDTLVFVNEGNLKHQFFSREIGMDVSYSVDPKSEFWSLNFLGAGIRTFFCRLHHDETFSVYVSDTPLRAVPNQDGDYVIDDVPPGRYRLTLWSTAAERTIRTVRVNGQGQLIENIQLDLSESGQ